MTSAMMSSIGLLWPKTVLSVELDELVAAKGQVAADKAKETTATKQVNEAEYIRYISFSLTNFFTIFAEVKEYFDAKNNQLGLEVNVQG